MSNCSRRSLIVANIIMIPLGILCIKVTRRILRVPREILMPMPRARRRKGRLGRYRVPAGDRSARFRRAGYFRAANRRGGDAAFTEHRQFIAAAEALARAFHHD